jgi:hypothetical protein
VRGVYEASQRRNAAEKESEEKGVGTHENGDGKKDDKEPGMGKKKPNLQNVSMVKLAFWLNIFVAIAAVTKNIIASNS